MLGLPVEAAIFVRIVKSEKHPPVPFIHKLYGLVLGGITNGILVRTILCHRSEP